MFEIYRSGSFPVSDTFTSSDGLQYLLPIYGELIRVYNIIIIYYVASNWLLPEYFKKLFFLIEQHFTGSTLDVNLTFDGPCERFDGITANVNPFFHF